MTTCLIHIGLPKTASTFLQHKIFPNCKQVEFINEAQHARKVLGKKDGKFEYLIRSIMTESDNYFDNVKLKKMADSIGSKNAIISSEKLSYLGDNIDISTKAKRLKELTRNFKKIKIVMIIREQSKLLESMYFQWLKGAGKKYSYMNFSSWFNLKKRENNIIENLLFFNIIQKYEAVFGKDSIEIILYENFKKNPGYIESRFEKLLETEINFSKINNSHSNPRISSLRLFFIKNFNYKLMRLFKMIIPKLIINIALNVFDRKPNLNTKENLTQDDIENIVQNNLSLSKRYNLNLKDYGYYC